MQPTTAKPPVTVFRACELCSHTVVQGGRLQCHSAAVRIEGAPQPIEVARSASGRCGPNARHLDMPAWHA